MASAIKTEDYEPNDRRLSAAADTSAAEAALKAKLSRKRTKTGCLTCRKRRIKCGEERPVCRNCIKSKRHCEGYNQRVVFKPPTFDYQPVANGGAHITFQAGPVQVPQPPHSELHPSVLDPAVYGQLRPRPPDHQYVTVWDGQLQRYVTVEQPHHQHAPHGYPMESAEYGHPQRPVTQAMPGTPQVHSFHPPSSEHFTVSHPHTANFAPQIESDGSVNGINVQLHQHQFAPSNGHGQSSQTPANYHSTLPVTTLPAEYVAHAYEPPTPIAGHFAHERFQQSPDAAHTHLLQDAKPQVANGYELVDVAPLSTTSSRTMSFSQTPVMPMHQQQWTPTSQGAPNPMPPGSGPPIANAYFPEFTQAASTTTVSHTSQLTPEYYEHEVHVSTFHSTTDILNAAAVEIQDDDYYDVASDEEVDVELDTLPSQDQKRQRTLGRILAHNKISIADLQARRYDTFIYAGILDHYRVDEVASPLKNPATARVFAHFVSATGPSLSIFERHPRNTSMLFAESAIPFSQQGLWTYTMPMAALRNQGLLHAMLAIASLHIARLQNASVTPSMQHYAWALRRIHASVGKPSSRLKVSTMAASMLLGFYEIMTADHMKWNTHLAGSKQLFVETDFVKMAKEFRRLKLERAAAMGQDLGRKRRHSCEDPFSQADMLDQICDVDDRVISEMIGREVRYGDHGHVETPHMSIPPGLDLGKFEILKDLYWWYCKQDVYQSLVSGNPLLMDFNRWGNCPPRAPLGRVDAVYGSFDHLVLLLGRIADFASRDRERKLMQVKANGGQWKPSPGMNMPGPPPQAAPPPTPVSANGGPPGQTFGQQPMVSPGGTNPMPQFFGMAPPPRANVRMPAMYAPFTPTHSLPTPQSAYPADPADYGLHQRTEAALEEYGRIRSALLTFSISLGEAFKPLGSDHYYPMNTPFGTALVYRSYDIGCLWAIYNMAMIICIRSHPHMPPAAHMAAGVAAQETSHYAQEIGRIAAGIVPGPPDQPLNPTLGAALCESCMPSFFAAVQYREPDQRRTTVERIFSIAKRTGWGSAELIANGCETAWVKAADAGRGPPYTRIVRPDRPNEDPRLNGSWEKLDPNSRPNENDDTDRRLVRVKSQARLNWAIGVMGVEADVEKISIND